MKQLKKGPFIDPFIWNNAPMQVVVRDGSVVVSNDGRETVYEFLNDDPYPDGTACTLYASMKAESAGEVFEKELAGEQRIEQRRQRDADARAEQEAAAVAFNKSLNIPAMWRPEIKIVLSGLTAGSNSSGHNRRTVEHVYLIEELHDGRLHRPADSYLCSAGGRFHTNVMGRTGGLLHEVTCKACLKIAKRWQVE